MGGVYFERRAGSYRAPSAMWSNERNPIVIELGLKYFRKTRIEDSECAKLLHIRYPTK